MKNNAINNISFINNSPLWATFPIGVVDGISANNENSNNAQCRTKYVKMNLMFIIHTESYIFPYFSIVLFL